jgi:ATP-binding cassette subfamily B protein
MQEKLDNLNLVTREGLSGIRVIRAFNRSGYEKNRFGRSSYELAEIAVRVNKIMASMIPLMMFFMNVASIAIVWFGSHFIDKNELQIGGMMAFLQYAALIMFSLLMFAMMFIMIPRAQASAVRICQVLDIHPEIADPARPEILNGKINSLEFRHVNFNYHGAEQPALSDICFRVMKGEVTAVVGGTGSGKSTLVNLIPRFYDTTSGDVLINNIRIQDLSQNALRERISLVPQSTMLFSDSIAENIRYGKEDASDEEVKRAADVALASEFISEKDYGFDTSISQGGKNISGGQKQRLAIARALVRKSDIYIFDDSFSALDFKTEADIRASLKEEIKDSIVIVISQRISTIMSADRIIVLEEGNIAGIGRHDELMKNCKVYREIAASQLSEEAEK